ncbi:MAG: hypothetical protein HC783_10650 [Rhodobacteraceae bacterium]|nr:hypothetical protein [Paracoccaceae bacterium]
MIAAVFALSAYNQAAEPRSRLWLVALLVVALAYGYLEFAMPADLSGNDAATDRHPDAMKFKAAGHVEVAAGLSLLGAWVGGLFRAQATAARIGGYAFVATFVGLYVLGFFLVTAR